MSEIRETHDVEMAGEVRKSGMSFGLGSLHDAIKRLSTGEQAQLRRDPGTTLAFYKLQAAAYFPTVSYPETLERWMLLIRSIAIVADLYDANTTLGGGLAKARLSELRLTRLLRARDERLKSEVLAAARFLKSKGQSQNSYGFRDLLTVQAGTVASDRARHRIASDYYLAIQS